MLPSLECSYQSPMFTLIASFYLFNFSFDMLKHYVDSCLNLVKTVFFPSVCQDVFMLLICRCPVYLSNSNHCMEIKKCYIKTIHFLKKIISQYISTTTMKLGICRLLRNHSNQAQ